jgi:hypothetical protein
VIFATGERQLEPVANVVVGGLEAEHEQGMGAVGGAGQLCLPGVDEAAVRGIQTRLRKRPDGRRPGGKVFKAHRGGGAVNRPGTDPDPRLGDDPERAFGAQQKPVGGYAGT